MWFLALYSGFTANVRAELFLVAATALGHLFDALHAIGSHCLSAPLALGTLCQKALVSVVVIWVQKNVPTVTFDYLRRVNFLAFT